MKSSEQQFILEIKAHPYLYNKKSRSAADEEQCKTAWNEIARKFKLKSAEEAEAKWKVHEEQFMYHMYQGTPYDYPHEMSFLQQYMFHKDLDNDSDVDYQELSRVLQQSDMEYDEKYIHNYLTASDRNNVQQVGSEHNIQIVPVQTDNTVEILLSGDNLIYIDRDEQPSVQANESQNRNRLAIEERMAKKTEIEATHAAINANSETSIIQNFSSIELIFLGYAKTISKMPMALQLKIKRAIAEIMDNAEMELMNAN